MYRRRPKKIRYRSRRRKAGMRGKMRVGRQKIGYRM